MTKTEAKTKKTEKIKYDPASIEPKWQAVWEEEGLYQPDMENANRPFYTLMMFPYPSAEGLHVGSMYAFGGADVYGRFKRMQGYDVFEPIGLDGFGIHSENHAIKTNTHPVEHAKRTEDNFYRQLRAIGNGFAWKNKLETYDPNYYKWTQWIFTELFKTGLAYRKKSPVNYCPSCKTVLSDEQVIDGKCERCGTVVEKKALEQWFFKITEYADRLLANIEKLDWTEKVKIAQRNWIGKKEGINITYLVTANENPSSSPLSEGEQDYSSLDKGRSGGVRGLGNYSITVFTTRPDTNFGATFIALAPEHPFALDLATPDRKEQVKAYIQQATMKSEIERQAEGKEKTGVFTGSYAINQLTGYRMPIWVSDFVLAGFGTGVLVGVPAHDKRDFEFATKFGLEIRRVVVGKDRDVSPITTIEQVQEEEGTMINSGFLDGMDIHEATRKIMDYMEEKEYGKREVTYHLRDWLISRQRYWGPPIPMIYCEACAKIGKSWFITKKSSDEKDFSSFTGSGDTKETALRISKSLTDNPELVKTGWESAGWYPVPREDLPVRLPYIEDFRPLGTGKSPLANHPEFVKVKCPGCGSDARRETDVSDNFLDSAWYFFGYLSVMRDDAAFDQKFAKKWLPVNMYIGGAEHSVLHLLYSRFITMALHDLGYIDFEEPFSRFYAHGLIIKDGAKMSKSKGNVINPDDYIRKFGADTLRTYLLFLGPFNQGGDFRDSGVEGMHRFLKRVWKLLIRVQRYKGTKVQRLDKKSLRMMHKTIKGVTEDVESLRYNTAVAKLMTYYNFLAEQKNVSREEAEVFLKLLAPFAPHLTEEIWERLGNTLSIHTAQWPHYEGHYLQQETVNIPVQVNGKLRGMLVVNADAASDRLLIEKNARDEEGVARFLEGKEIRQVIFVEGKVINFVVKEC